MSPINEIGIVGAGRIGVGIAQISALAEYRTLVFDNSEKKITSLMQEMTTSLAKAEKLGKIDTNRAKSALENIHTVSCLSQMASADMVVEAVSEDLNTKSAVFADLDATISPDCIRASTTSSLSITRLASMTDHPHRLIGLHFMNPVPAMKLVEVVRGLATDDHTYKTATGVVERMGKTFVNSEDFPGFIVNRILLPMINEAIYTLHEGVGSVETIDNAMRLGTNHPMGPLELADFIGLDTVLAVLQTIHDGLADTKYRPCPLLVKYVEAGWVGRSSGRGFYDYSADPPVPTR